MQLPARARSRSEPSATALAPVIAFLLGTSASIIAAITFMGVFVYWRHRSNIRNLINGSEDKIGATQVES